MADRLIIPLKPTLITPESPEYAQILLWSFAENFVGRLLRSDIPQRYQRNQCRIWAYFDPYGPLVGFGSLDLCREYAAVTNQEPHSYIPLLGVNPGFEGRGHGKFIVRHLTAEALFAAADGLCSNELFLDVYVSASRTIKLYENCGFRVVSPEPIHDPQEDDREYVIMYQSVVLGFD